MELRTGGRKKISALLPSRTEISAFFAAKEEKMLSKLCQSLEGVKIRAKMGLRRVASQKSPIQVNLVADWLILKSGGGLGKP